MNTGNRLEQVDMSADKFEAHYRRQLSSLVDGELAADEARFMLRRIEHDAELAACQERWQLLGDALRGQACAPAPVDFSSRVRQAIAAGDPGGHREVPVSRPVTRGSWRRWSGGAALAASVAAVALFMAREQVPETAIPETVIATTAQVATPVVAPVAEPSPAAAGGAGLATAVPAIAVAAARRQETVRRGSATRNQQSARASAVRLEEPQRAVAVAPSAPVVPPSGADPFSSSPATLHARPWPRSAVATGLPQGAFNARFPAQEPGGATFYPFEPRLPAESAGEAGLHELLPQH
ncbi:sigma-E factor negative regulatory protein [Stenotrophomonas sp. JC08]|uniref:sigma-E factor negative regulatory protein n=1 Tax=Stenotrophomonas sp. JC08 TaxID=3445779 RepID=UPI003FA216E4